LEALNAWIESQRLPRGIVAYDLADAASGRQQAVLDLAWPNGMQEELSQPVAVLLNEEARTVTLASQAGFRCFTDDATFRRYVKTEVLEDRSAGGNQQSLSNSAPSAARTRSVSGLPTSPRASPHHSTGGGETKNVRSQ
jgi:hypothetical protein